MKKHGYIYSFILIFTCLSYASAKSKQSVKMKNEKVVIAYVTSWSSVLPDAAIITHINYAFGHVNETFNGITISNENRLRELVKLKKQKPTLKILLSIGGWGSGRFSEMAGDNTNRENFALDCKRVTEVFGLDGIDIDWEYPTANMAGISASPDDKENFSLLMRDLRLAIGKHKLLTLATAANAKYYDFKKIVDYVDFVNMMTYDMGTPPYHHSALYPSEFTHQSGDEATKAHLKAGVPAQKLVYGVPFYGRGTKQLQFTNYKDIVKNKNFTEKWDDKAKVPYLINDQNETVCVFDNPASLIIKCNYIIENNLCGVMYWDYDGDDASGTLSKTLWENLKKK